MILCKFCQHTQNFFVFFKEQFFYENHKTDWEAIVVSVIEGLNSAEELDPGTQSLDSLAIADSVSELGNCADVKDEEFAFMLYLDYLVEMYVLESRSGRGLDQFFVRYHNSQEWKNTFRQCVSKYVVLLDNLITVICDFTLWKTRKPAVPEVEVCRNFLIF